MERLVDIKEVCKLLGVKRDWVYRKTKKRKIPHFRIEGHLRFSVAEVGEYLEKNRRKEDG
jgi:excisionase family DNA binding protein